MKPSYWNRKIHRVGAIATAVPVLVILVTGVLLMLKKDVAWIQPPTERSASPALTATWPEILAATRAVPEAGVDGWQDVDRLDVRPDKGVVKVRCKNRWEIQLDAATAEVLAVAYRRSDLIESLHDGSWFHGAVKLWIFLPTALVLCGLWATGIYLWWLPHQVKRRRRRLVRTGQIPAPAPRRSA